MVLSIRDVEDCVITVPDVEMLAVYESQKKFEDCYLLNVSWKRKDADPCHYENVVDLEVY